MLLGACVGVEGETGGRVGPRLVDVRIEGTVRTTLHESAPDHGIEAEGIVHDVLPVRCAFLDDEISLPVELFEFFDGGLLPRLVHRLQAQDGGMEPVQSDNLLNDPERVGDIVVVDNGSNDYTLKIVAQMATRESITIHHHDGESIASVRNCGARNAKGKILAFLDGDCLAHPRWLATGIELLLPHQNIGAVGFIAAEPDETASWVEKGWHPISSSGKYQGTKPVRWLSSFNETANVSPCRVLRNKANATAILWGVYISFTNTYVG